MNDVLEREVTALPAAAGGQVTPMRLLEIATQQGADVDKLSKLMDLQLRWEQNEARKAFVTALNAFKAAPPDLHKNKGVSYGQGDRKTEYRHATLDHVALEIGKAMAPHGLSFRWETEQQDGGVRVTCILTHDMGHSERVTLQASPDTSGSKNSIQAIGSTVTYLQRYTLLAATGMAVKGQDDDGRGAGGGGKPEITPDEDGKAKLEACATVAKLKAAWAALTPAQRSTLNGVMAACKKAIEDADK